MCIRDSIYIPSYTDVYLPTYVCTHILIFSIFVPNLFRTQTVDNNQGHVFLQKQQLFHVVNNLWVVKGDLSLLNVN